MFTDRITRELHDTSRNKHQQPTKLLAKLQRFTKQHM